MSERLVVEALWTGAELLRRAALLRSSEGVITAIGAAGPEEAALPGLVCAGFVNAHTHLELSHLRGRVPGGAGSVAWVRALFAENGPRQAGASELRAALAEARAAGTVALVDVSNGGHTGGAIAEAGLQGVVLAECIGLSPARFAPALHAAALPTGWPGAVLRRATAHSPVSCSPALLAAALGAAEGGPWPTIHCDEDPDDRLLLADRQGAWVGLHAALGNPLDALGRAPSGLRLLGALGLLGPRLGLVHLVAADAEDIALLAASGATAVLCPRSNLHIGGRLPSVAALVAAGVPLAIGTDSLASAPDLDLLAEAAALAAAAPGVDPQRWLEALTEGGARLLGPVAPAGLRVGARPALLHLALPPGADPLAALFDGTRWPRRWLSPPAWSAP